MATKNYFGDKGQTIVNSSFTAKAQPINLDDKNIIDPDIIDQTSLVSGDINDAKKSTIVGGKDVFGGGSKGTAVPSNPLGDDTIVGDATNLTDTTFTGGADKITLKGMNHTNATVIGDAISVNGGTTRGGNDTIIVEEAINGGTIIGDVETVTNTNFIAGNDNIQLKGVVSGATIYTDAKTLAGANTFLGGNDIVTLGEKPAKGESVLTTVIDTDIYLGHGNDNLTAHSTIGTGTSIYGEDGNDRFTITKMEAGSIDGGAGNDTFSLATVTGNIDGGDGNDSITIENYTGAVDNSELFGGKGNDKITVTTATNANIDGDGGNDTITVTNLYGGSIQGITGNTSIKVTTATNADIYGANGDDIINVRDFTGTAASDKLWGDDGDDKITVTTATAADIDGNAGDDTITVTNLNAGSIEGGDDDDRITATTSKDADISGNAGDDTITVINLIDGKVSGHTGVDSIKITTMDGNAEVYGDAPSEGGINDKDTIVITTVKSGSVYGGDGNDTITITTAESGRIDGEADDDKITVSTVKLAQVNGGVGNDSIKITTVDGGTVNGDNGNDTITISSLKHGSVSGTNGNDSITINTFTGSIHGGEVGGGADDDTITIGSMTDAKITDTGGNDSVKISTLKGEYNNINLRDGNDTLTINNFTANKANIASENALSMGDGDDSLNILAKKTNYTDTDFAEALGAGDDTLNVNWAFNGEFNSGNDNGTLITKGLGADAVLNFGFGNDGLTITGAASGNKSGLSDTELAESLGDGQDTLNVGWAFNGTFDTTDNAFDQGGTLITKGLHANSTLQFGASNDGLQVIGALANRQINTHGGADTVSISSTATNVQVNLGTGADVFSVGAMGKGSTLTYNTDDLDNITIKGTYNDGMVVDAAGEATALSTGSDGGSITLDTLGTGQLVFGAGNDSITINKNLAGTSAVKKEINTLGDNDDIDIKGTVTNAVVDAGTGADHVSIGALSTGSTLKYDADDTDNITIKGTYNAGFAQTSTTAGTFYGLATGDDGGVITLDTLGTGKLQFGAGQDTLTINKALAGSFGLKDIFMQAGNDSVILNTVNGAVISGGEGLDYISATGLGTTGVLNGDGGEDTIQIGRKFTDADSFKATAIMNNGTINGGADNDSIYVGNTFDADNNNIIDPDELKGTLSGGKVYGGAGNDYISTTTLSGSGLMDGGDGVDHLRVTTMSGGTIAGGNDGDTVIIDGTFSRGTINGDAGGDRVDITTMSGGTINAGDGNDTISIDNFKGGIISGDAGIDSITIDSMTAGTLNSDAGADSVRVNSILGGTINASAGDTIDIGIMDGGTINDSDENIGTIKINDIYKGTINTNDGNDSVDIFRMHGGTINGQDGNDSIDVGYFNGGTINAGEGDNQITVKYGLRGGNISAGAGNDTLILQLDDNEINGKYSINLGAGKNIIRVKSDLDGQELILGASNDNVFLDAKVQNAKISLGNGNDTIITSDQDDPVTTTNTLIDTGAGNDSMNLESAQDGTIIYAGAGDDRIILQNSYSAVVDLGTGNNYIQTAGTASNVVIIGGSGSDTVNIATNIAGDSFISTGTGNDRIKGNLIDNSSGEDSIGGSIHYDNKGQDTIVLNEYRAGMIADATGNTTDADDNYFALSTGTDGGTIEINTWTSGEITLGNGHDSLSIGTNNSAKTDTEITDLLGKGNDTLHVGWSFNGDFAADDDGGTLIATGLGDNADITFGRGNDGLILSGNLSENVDLKTGNDTVTINGFENDATFTYDNDGFDNITINSAYTGGADDGNGMLSTGKDGGFIHVNEITNVGIEKLEFYEGKANEGFSIGTLRSGNNAGEINLWQGTDSITVGSIGAEDAGTATIKYNTDGQDSIVIEGEYAGVGIKYTNGSDTTEHEGISTGSDGGFISIGRITDEAGVDNLEFSDKNDKFEIGTLNVDGQAEGGGNVGDDTINLGAGNDYIKVTNLRDGTIDGGAGNDTYSIQNLGDTTVGEGSVVIEDTDGGINVFDITNMNNASISANGNTGRGTFDIEYLNNSSIDGTDGAGGHDVFTIGTMVNSSAVYGSSGNDSFHVTSVSASSILGDEGNDSIDVTLASSSNISGGDGNDKIIVDSFTSAEIGQHKIDAGTGNDNIDVTAMNGGTIEGGTATKAGSKLGVDTITVENASNAYIYGDIDGGSGADTTVSYNDLIKVTGLADNTNIYGGHGNDTISVANAINLSEIHGGEGNNNITVSHATNSEIDAGAGNDKITIGTTAGSSSIESGGGKDSIDITTMNGGSVHGQTGNDSIDVDTMQVGTINGGNDDDTIEVTTMNRGVVDGGAGNDKITINTINVASPVQDITMGSIKLYGAETIDDWTKATKPDGSITWTSSHGTITFTLQGEFDFQSNTTGTFNIDYYATYADGTTGLITTKTVPVQPHEPFAFTDDSMSGSSVRGGIGDDTITITTLNGESVTGQENNDTIKVTTMNGGVADGGTGNDVITVTTARGGNVLGDAGDDKITVTTGMGDKVDGGFSLNGGDGNDTITMTTLNRGTIEGGIDADTITVKNAYASSIYGDENGGSDTTAYNDIIKVTGLAEGTDIFGGHGNDTITVGSATAESTINGGDGDDSITVTTLTDGTINGGDGTDNIKVITLANSSIVGNDGADTITVTTSTNSYIFDGEGDDSITITTANHSSISSGAGNDTIKVTTLNGSSIDSGAGEDEIYVINQIKSAATFTNGGDVDKIFLNGGIGAGAEVTLSGSDGFNVAKSETAGFNMSGGELTGSDRADTFHIATMSNGIVSGGAGADSITVKISGASKGVLFGGEGADVFTIDSSTNKASSITIQDFEIGTDILYIGDDTVAVEQGKTFVEHNGITVNFGNVYIQDNKSEEDNINNVTLNGTNNIDTFNISGTATNSTINALVGDDSITIGTINASTINTGAGADTTTINNAITKAATITNEGGADKLYLGGGIGKGGHVSLEGTDGFVVAQSVDATDPANPVYSGFNLASGTLTGSDGADIFHIATMSSGTLTGGADADSITVATANGGVIDGGADADLITITHQVKKSIEIANSDAAQDSLILKDGIGSGGNVQLQGNGGFVVAQSVTAYNPDHLIYTGFNLASGTLTGSNGADKFYIEKMSSGTLTGEAGEDTFFITTLSGGIVHGGADADRLTIYTMTGGTVDGGAGVDTVTISSAVDSKITIKNTGAEQDFVYLINSLAEGGNVILTSNAGFNLSKDGTDGFNMTTGTITGSAGADSINIDQFSGGTVNANAGNDNINITTMNGGTLLGGTGNDTISVDSMSSASAEIDAGTGNDLVKVDAIVGTIDGGTGTDTLYLNTEVTTDHTSLGGVGSSNFEAYGFESMSAGSINGTAKADNILINTMSGGIIYGNAGNDVLTVKTMTGGDLNGGDGNDTISITHLTGAPTDIVLQSIIYNNGSGSRETMNEWTKEVHDGYITWTHADYGRITFVLAGETVFEPRAIPSGTLAIDYYATYPDGGTGPETQYTFDIADPNTHSFNDVNRTGSDVKGGAGNDYISIDNMFGGFVDGGDGVDTINIDEEIAHSIRINNTGIERDVVNIEGGIGAGGNVTLRSTDGSFNVTVTSMAAGTSLTASAGDDSITIYDINGSDDASQVEVNTGLGADTVVLDTNVDSHITITNGDDIDNAVFITGGVVEGANITLDGSYSGFDMASSFNAKTKTFTGFDMSGGTINGSVQADNIVVSTMSDNETGTTINGNAGDDTFTVTTMNGGEIKGGNGKDSFTIATIDGHGESASTLNGGEGDDTFTITTMNGGVINGDDGADSIKITTLNGGEIDGGAGADTINIINQVKGVATITNTADADTIFLAGGIGTGADITLSGTSGFTVSKSYNESLDLHNYFNVSGGSLTGSAGADTMYINSMTSGSVDGGDGNDSVYLSTMKGGSFYGGAGNDTVNILSMTGGSVDGGVGEDSIYFTNAISKALTIQNTGTENDYVRLGPVSAGANIMFESDHGFVIHGGGDPANPNGFHMSGGKLTGSAGADSIYIGKMTGGVVDGGLGDDEIYFTHEDGITKAITLNSTSGSDIIYLEHGINAGGKVTLGGDIGFTVTDSGGSFDMSGGSLIGSVGSDDIKMNEMTGGTVDSGAGVDDIQIVSMINGTVNAGDGADSVAISTMTGGTVNTGDGADSGDIFAMTDGTVNTGDGNDTIGVSMAGGTFNAGAGDDSIILISLAGGTVDGGAGVDSVIIINAMNGVASVKNTGTEQDNLYLNGGLVSGAELNLNSNAGFVVESVDNTDPDNPVYAGFNMSGGTLNGSAGADSITASMTGGSINGGAGDDSLSISIDGTTTDAFLNGGDGADVFSITNDSGNAGEISITNFEIGTDELIIGGDTISVAAGQSSVTHGDVTVNLVTEHNTITLSNAVTSLYNQSNNGTGLDTINLSKGIDNGGGVILNGTGGFNVGKTASAGFDLFDGSLIGSDGADIFRLNNIKEQSTIVKSGNRVVSTGAGDDTLSIANLSVQGQNQSPDHFIYHSVVNTGTGDDSISIKNMVNGQLYAGEGNDTLSVGINDASYALVDAGAGDDILNLTVKSGNPDPFTNTEIFGGGGADKFVILGSGNREIRLSDFNAVEGDTFFIGNTEYTGDITQAQEGGADTVKIGTVTVFLDRQFGDPSAGDDSIYANTLSTGETLGAGGGYDLIRIGTLNGGTVDGGTGTNAIIVNTVGAAGGTLTGGQGAGDTYVFTDVLTNSVTINDESGTDFVRLGGGIAEGGILNLISPHGFNLGLYNTSNTSNGFNMYGGTINGSDGHDSIEIATMQGGNIIGNAGHDDISIATMHNGSIDMGAGNDDVTITTLHGGNIQMGAGQDTVNISVIDITGQVSIDGGADTDSLNITGAVSTIVNIAEVKDFATNFETFGFDTIVNGGTIQGTAAADNISVTTMLGGTINGGASNDSIEVYINSETNEATIYGGDGNDEFRIASDGTGATINLLDFATGDSVFINDRNLGYSDFTTAVTEAKNRGDESYTDNVSGITINFVKEPEPIIVNSIVNDAQSFINARAGQDTLVLTKGIGTSGEVNLSGAGGFFVVGHYEEMWAFDHFNTSGTINGSEGDDRIVIDQLKAGAVVNGNAGDDFIEVETLLGVVDGGEGDDGLSFTGQVSGRLDLSSANIKNIEAFSFGSYVDFAANANVLGTANAETFHIQSITKGALSGEAGNDTFSITLDQQGADLELTGGEGADVFWLYGAGEITIMDFDAAEGDFVSINTQGINNEIIAARAQGDASYTHGSGENAVTIHFGDITPPPPGTEFINEPIITERSFTNGSGKDTLHVNGDMYIGGRLSLSGDNGFVLTTSDGDGFDMLGGSTGSFTGSSISGSAGADDITINNWTNHPDLQGFGYGDVSTGAGADVVTVKNMAAYGYVNTGAGNDVINLSNMIRGDIYGGDGNDKININKTVAEDLSMEGTIKGGAGNDSITFTDVTTQWGMNLYGGYGADTFTITNSSGIFTLHDLNFIEGDSVVVNGANQKNAINAALQAGQDSLVIDDVTLNFTGFDVTGESTNVTAAITNAREYTNNVADTLNALNLNGGISAGGTVNLLGNGGFMVGSQSGGFDLAGTINGGTAADVIRVDTMSGNSIIRSGDGPNEMIEFVAVRELDDSIFVNIMNGNSQIDAGAGHDAIFVETMNGGSILGGSGNDNIEVVAALGGSIDGGEGRDYISIQSVITGTLNFTDSGTGANFETDGTNIVGIGAGANISVSGNGFNFSSHMMTGGTITGSDNHDMIIQLNSMSGGIINTGNGNTDVTANHVTNGVINGGSGDNRITIDLATDTKDAVSITSGAGTDTITLDTSTGHTAGAVTITDFSATDIIEITTESSTVDVSEDVRTAQASSDSYTFDGITIYFS